MSELKKTEDRAPAADTTAAAYTQAAPSSLTLKELNRLNKKYWEQPGGQFFPNHGYRDGKGE